MRSRARKVRTDLRTLGAIGWDEGIDPPGDRDRGRPKPSAARARRVSSWHGEAGACMIQLSWASTLTRSCGHPPGVRRRQDHEDGSLWAGAVLALPALPALLRELPTAPGGATAGAIFLGIVPSALGYLTWSYAVARTTLARSTASLYLVPVVALLLAWWWLGERPAPLAVLGGALAVLGVTIVRRDRR